MLISLSLLFEEEAAMTAAAEGLKPTTDLKDTQLGL